MPYIAKRFFWSVLQYIWPTCTFTVLDPHIKPFRVRDGTTHRHFMKLLLIIIVGKLFTAGYHSTAVALECDVCGSEQRCCWRLECFWMICCSIALIIPDVLKDRAAVIILLDPEDDTTTFWKVRNLLMQWNNITKRTTWIFGCRIICTYIILEVLACKC
jgi:hypothetical protein